MARRKTYKSKKKTKKKKEVSPNSKEALTARVRLGKLIKVKEDIAKLAERFGPEWPSFWCMKHDHWINMLACIHRKYIFKYHDECSKCIQIFSELAQILGDKIEELWEDN